MKYNAKTLKLNPKASFQNNLVFLKIKPSAFIIVDKFHFYEKDIFDKLDSVFSFDDVIIKIFNCGLIIFNAEKLDMVRYVDLQLIPEREPDDRQVIV